MDYSLNPKDHFGLIDTLDDQDIDVAYAALGLATLGSKNMAFYVDHLQALVTATAERYHNLVGGPAGGTAGTDAISNPQAVEHDIHKQLNCLQAIIFEQFSYQGNRDNYDQLENADLCTVIERRTGMPIALSIICIHVAKAQGWDAVGIAMPGHFICRLELDGERLVFDPFNQAKALGAPDLRALVKQALGPNAELKPEYYEAVSNRAILLRLQNNIKLRQLEKRQFSEALFTLETMRNIAPNEASLLFESGQLYANTDQPQAAINMLSMYLETAPPHYERSRANQLLQKLKSRLH